MCVHKRLSYQIDRYICSGRNIDIAFAYIRRYFCSTSVVRLDCNLYLNGLASYTNYNVLALLPERMQNQTDIATQICKWHSYGYVSVSVSVCVSMYLCVSVSVFV